MEIFERNLRFGRSILAASGAMKFRPSSVVITNDAVLLRVLKQFKK